jgi:hypothetical protein
LINTQLRVHILQLPFHFGTRTSHMTSAATIHDSYEVWSAENSIEIELTELWKSRRAVVVFLRQFGCRFCKQQVAGLNKIYAKLEKNQVALVAIGMGTVEQARAFKASSEFKGELYVDQHTEAPWTYDLFQLNRGAEFLKPAEGEEGFGPYSLQKRVFELGEKAIAEGFEDASPDKWTGNTSQIGGIFVLGPGNACDFAHRSSFVGDSPDIAAVLEAATGQTSDGKSIMYPSTELWSDNLKTHKKFNPNSPRRKSTSKPTPTPKDKAVGIANSWVGFALSCAVGLTAISFVVKEPYSSPCALCAAALSAVAVVVYVSVYLAAQSISAGDNNDAPAAGAEVALYTPNDIDR